MATNYRMFTHYLREAAENVLKIGYNDLVLNVPDNMLKDLSDLSAYATIVKKFKEVKPTFKIGDKIIITEADYVFDNQEQAERVNKNLANEKATYERLKAKFESGYINF